MLEAEEVDDDYFTPVANTSLANIFVNPSIEKDTENTSLKYTPPKLQKVTTKPDDIKTTQCIFACVIFGFQWYKNVYTNKGKIGFAITKILKTDTCNMVLYDSNKTSLSCTKMSPNLEVTVRGEMYISYYDDIQIYWSLYAPKDEIKKIIDTLKNFKVIINYFPYTDTGPPVPNKVENFIPDPDNKEKETESKGSDTDSSVDKKTKASVLSRMASMGHSVLPAHTILFQKDSDSSDTDKSASHQTIARHKTSKHIMKKTPQDNMTQIIDTAKTESLERVIIPKQYESIENIPSYPGASQVINSSVLTNFATLPGNDLNFFISEQRVNNSEMRININRMSDKLDHILNSITSAISIDKSKCNPNVLADVSQKLIIEYENKIKMYEELLKGKDISTNTKFTDKNEGSKSFSHISLLEELNKIKDIELSKLREEVNNLKFQMKSQISDDSLQGEVNELKQDLHKKSEELILLQNKYENMLKDNSVDAANKIKNIMNDTFRAISVNFDNDETYSGETIKNMIATIIKQITIESINGP